MFTKLFLLFGIIYSVHGNPLKTVQQHEIRQFFRTRIVGGVEAPPEYGKHMASLIFGDAVVYLSCGGSIVTRHHILTAAHCIYPMIYWGELMRSFRAAIGSNRWASTEKNIRFTGFTTHPNFNSTTLKNDVGVLFLAEDIKLSDNVAIIPLQYDWVDGGAECFVTGWGRLGAWLNNPEKLHLLYVNTITAQQCNEGVLKATQGMYRPPYHDPKVEICTFHSFGHGMCSGDSGSALVHKDTQTQIGIVSWGFPCAIGAPDVFVRVGAFKKWLMSILGDCMLR